MSFLTTVVFGDLAYRSATYPRARRLGWLVFTVALGSTPDQANKSLAGMSRRNVTSAARARRLRYLLKKNPQEFEWAAN
jgi:hypothetical protein